MKSLPKSVLVVGSSGTIGHSLSELLIAKQIPVWLTTRNIDEVGDRTLWLDLSRPASSWQLPNSSIQVAVVCAAVTSQKACQEEYATTYSINVVATVDLVKRLVKTGAFVIFLSTNLVFDGTSPNISPDQPVNPKTAYGKQKSETERALLSLDSDSIAIVRLSKVLDRKFSLFHNWIGSLQSNQCIHPFEDLYFAPISIDFVTRLLFIVIQQRLSGIVQASATEDISYAEAAFYLAQKLGIDTSLIQPISCRVAGVTHAPKFTTLNAERLKEIGIRLPTPFQVIDNLFLSHAFSPPNRFCLR